jgi:hypothetical protein
MDELERCLAFDRRVTLRGASERIEIPGGWVLREPALPNVFSLNMVILGSPLPSTLSAAELSAMADHWLADFGHRYVRLEDATGAERLATQLLEAGWERQRTCSWSGCETSRPPIPIREPGRSPRPSLTP